MSNISRSCCLNIAGYFLQKILVGLKVSQGLKYESRDIKNFKLTSQRQT